MGEDKHELVSELIPAYALGSLDPDEAVLVSTHLAACPACQAELAGYEEVAGLLALAAPDVEPPAALKGQLLARASAKESKPAAAPAPRPETKEPSWWQRLEASLGSWFAGPAWRPVALALILILALSNVVLLTRGGGSDHLSWATEFTLAGTEAAPEAMGVIYVSGDGRYGTLVVDGLPILSPEEQYQLWLIQDGVRTSGAVFSVNQDGYRGVEIVSPQPLGSYESFGVTIEPAGGSPGPTGERVLGYQL